MKRGKNKREISFPLKNWRNDFELEIEFPQERIKVETALL